MIEFSVLEKLAKERGRTLTPWEPDNSVEKSWRTQPRVPSGPKGGEWTSGGVAIGSVPVAADEHFDKVGGKLRQAEANALTVYSSTLHTVINEKLRTGVDLGHSAGDVKTLDGLAEKFRTNAEVVTYRGTFAKAFQSMTPGDTFVDKGFVSTTSNADLAKSFSKKVNRDWKGMETGGVLEIRVPKGHNVIPVNKVIPSGLTSHEQEMLLPRGTKFRFEGSRKDDRTKQQVFTVSVVS